MGTPSQPAQFSQIPGQPFRPPLIPVHHSEDPGVRELKASLRRVGHQPGGLFVQFGKPFSVGGVVVEARQFLIQRRPVGHFANRSATQEWKACVGLSITAEKTPPAKPGAPRPFCIP